MNNIYKITWKNIHCCHNIYSMLFHHTFNVNSILVWSFIISDILQIIYNVLILENPEDTHKWTIYLTKQMSKYG